MAERGHDTQLRDRVSQLVTKSFGGSVRAAAGAVGVPQRTLANIVSGSTAHPRSDILQALANGFGTTVDWLLSGRGDAPTGGARAEEPIFSSWNSIVRQLDLPPQLEAHFRLLPRALIKTDELFGTDLSDWLPTRDEPVAEVPEDLLKDSRRLATAWTSYWSRKIDERGLDAVRAALLKNPNRTLAIGVPITAFEPRESVTPATPMKRKPKKRT